MKTKQILITFGVLIAITAVFYLVTGAITKYTGHVVDLGSIDDFAKCLTSQGIELYVKTGCSHCADQKAMFGKSVKYLNMTDCLNNPSKCVDEGIEYIPAWKINSTIKYDVKKLKELAELSGCKLN